MRARTVGFMVMMAVCTHLPLAGSEFVVAAATGVLEPEDLEAGRELATGTRVRLESWGQLVVRETTGCRLTLVLAGTPEHELTPPEDCAATVEPAVALALLQRGAVFQAHLTPSGVTDELVQAIAREPCVFLARVSEEGDNRRRCPSGYALRTLRCSGQFCDDKDLLCCPYLAGEPDPTAKGMALRVISEEAPNSLVQTKKGFLDGLSCYGPYCDEVEPHQLKSPRLSNTRECDWSSWTSDRPDEWLDCGADRLMSGLRCRDDYCGEIAVLCCRAEAE